MALEPATVNWEPAVVLMDIPWMRQLECAIAVLLPVQLDHHPIQPLALDMEAASADRASVMLDGLEPIVPVLQLPVLPTAMAREPVAVASAFVQPDSMGPLATLPSVLATMD